MKVNIYYSFWRIALLLLGSLVFVCIGIELFDEHPVVALICIIFCGLCGLFLLGCYLYSLISHRPPMVIDDEGVSFFRGFLGKYSRVNFDDVAAPFELVMYQKNAHWISVYLKEEALQGRKQNTSSAGRWAMKANEAMGFTAISLPADNFSLKPQRIVDLLNERLSQRQAQV